VNTARLGSRRPPSSPENGRWTLIALRRAWHPAAGIPEGIALRIALRIPKGILEGIALRIPKGIPEGIAFRIPEGKT